MATRIYKVTTRSADGKQETTLVRAPTPHAAVHIVVDELIADVSVASQEDLVDILESGQKVKARPHPLADNFPKEQ